MDRSINRRCHDGARVFDSIPDGSSPVDRSASYILVVVSISSTRWRNQGHTLGSGFSYLQWPAAGAWIMGSRNDGFGSSARCLPLPVHCISDRRRHFRSQPIGRQPRTSSSETDADAPGAPLHEIDSMSIGSSLPCIAACVFSREDYY